MVRSLCDGQPCFMREITALKRRLPEDRHPMVSSLCAETWTSALSGEYFS